MFFVGFISTMVPYLLTAGLILAAFYQLNSEVKVSAEELLLCAEKQEICVESGHSTEADDNTISYQETKQLAAETPQTPPLIAPTKQQTQQELLYINYQSRTSIRHSGLSPPVCI